MPYEGRVRHRTTKMTTLVLQRDAVDVIVTSARLRCVAAIQASHLAGALLRGRGLPRRFGRRATRAAEQADKHDAEPLLQERIDHGIDGGVEPQQPEDHLQREVRDAEVADWMDEGADLVRSPREQEDEDENGQRAGALLVARQQLLRLGRRLAVVGARDGGRRRSGARGRHHQAARPAADVEIDEHVDCGDGDERQDELDARAGDQVPDVVVEVDVALAVGNDRPAAAERLPQENGRSVPDGSRQPRHGHTQHGDVGVHLESILDRTCYAPVPIQFTFDVVFAA